MQLTEKAIAIKARTVKTNRADSHPAKWMVGWFGVGCSKAASTPRRTREETVMIVLKSSDKIRQSKGSDGFDECDSEERPVGWE